MRFIICPRVRQLRRLSYLQSTQMKDDFTGHRSSPCRKSSQEMLRVIYVGLDHACVPSSKVMRT